MWNEKQIFDKNNMAVLVQTADTAEEALLQGKSEAPPLNRAGELPSTHSLTRFRSSENGTWRPQIHA